MKFRNIFIAGLISMSSGLAMAQSNTEHKEPAKKESFNQNVLTSEVAQTMALAAERAAQKEGFAIVVSIIDNHGNLKYFNRMDGTSFGSIEVSQLKALTSAKFPVSSKTLAERSANLPGNPYAAIPGMLVLEGGLPIFNQAGAHIGAIGISGATPELDAKFAQAGIDSLVK
ncbi:heme-binding protein [Pantoea sp. B9002]|uniref:GlcG/HbpS family heme-binding protein n=1 Tax=Pantoea sp. B9002 TaxID=2726979 RepID=UPI001C432949|nr:heme-binding protein [Pantoea sp. B9002]